MTIHTKASKELSSSTEVLPDGKDVWLDMLPRWLQTKLHIRINSHKPAFRVTFSL